jgi:ribose 5-phosphate isomerase B
MGEKITIAIACDHAGPALKSVLKRELEGMGFILKDFGTDGTESVDYPDYAKKVADAVAKGKADKGLLICGSGIGISIAANRNPKIRCALCHNEETARLARQHNDANVLALGARVVNEATAKACARAFFTTPFEGGRHQRRVDKLSC